MWNLKYDNKLVNKTKKKQTHRNRELTNGYQWGDERQEGQYRDRGKKEFIIIMGLYEIMCVKLLKIVKHYRI